MENQHNLLEIIFMAIVATICRAETWQEIAAFAEEKEMWFRNYLTLEHGIPSHDTFERCFCIINPKQSQKCFIAWASENGIVLGQIKTEEKSNEITAIPQLLDLLVVEVCVVTIDAMGTQKEIVKKICTEKADYVLAVKENQPNLYMDTMPLA